MNGSEIARLYASVGADVSDYKRGLGFVKSSLGDLSGQMGGVLKVVGGLGAAIGGALAAREIIDNTKAFTKQLTNIQSLGGRTAEDMQKLRDVLLDTGKNTILEGGAQSAGQAFYDIASGVQGADKQMSIFNAAIATAEAGQANLAATSSGLVSVINSYGLEAKEATRVSDIFTRTVGLGVGTMDQFVSALSPIANLAATAGVSFGDLGEAAAFLTAKGATTGDAATEIQSTLVALLKPSEDMKGAFQKLGVASGEALIKQYGFVGALKKLRGTTDGSVSSLTGLLHRVEALRGVVALTGDDFGDFSKTFKDGLTGATEAAREIQRNSPEAKITKFGNQLNALGIKIGSVLLPPLGDLAELLGKIIDQVGEATKPFREFIGAIAGPIVEKGRKAFTKFTDQFGDFVSNVRKFGLKEALDSALNLGGNGYEMGWVQSILVALGMAKDEAGSFVTTVKQGVDILLNYIQQGVLKFQEGGIGGILQWIFLPDDEGGVLSAMQNAIGNVMNGIWAFISDNASKLSEAFQDVLGKVGDWLGSDGPGQLATGLADMFKGAADWVVNTGWPTFKKGVEKLVANIAAFFQGEGWMKFVSGIRTMFSNAVNWLTTVGIPEFVKAFAKLGADIVTWFQNGGWTNFREGLILTLNNAANWIRDQGWPRLQSAVGTLVENIGKAFDSLKWRITNAILNGVRESMGLPGITLGNSYSPPPSGTSGKSGSVNYGISPKSLSTSTVKKTSATGRGITPFAAGGFAPIGTRFMAGEAGPELGIVGASGTTFKPMYAGAGAAGGGRSVNVYITVDDKNLIEQNLIRILEREIGN